MLQQRKILTLAFDNTRRTTMKEFTSQAIHVRSRLRQSLVIFTLAVFLLLTSIKGSYASSLLASNQTTQSFGPDQTIIDLNQLTWKPLRAPGVTPGPEMNGADLRIHRLKNVGRRSLTITLTISRGKSFCSSASALRAPLLVSTA